MHGSDPAPAPSSRLVVGLLGLSQIVGYGTIYYSLAILAGDIGAEFGWPVSKVFGILSLSLLGAGLFSPFSGRLIDRFGAARMMVVGSAFAAMALAAMALAPTGPLFALGLLMVELASTFVLYNAAFSCLVQATGRHAQLPITHLTLIAGFASTIFWPLTTFLDGHLSWRAILGLFALANLLLCLPAHLAVAALLKRGAQLADGTPARPPAAQEAQVQPSRRKQALILVVAGFSFSSFLNSGILAQMVPLLHATGLGTATVLVSTLFGPAQVLVRFVNMTAGSGRHPLTITLIAAAILPLASAVLALSAPSLIGAVLFMVLLGSGSGLSSIVQGTLPLVLFGSAGYAERLGRMAAVRFFSTAIAPFVLAYLIETVGPATALAVMTVVGLAGFCSFLAVGRLMRRS